MVEVICNGSQWIGEAPDSLDGLLNRLATHPLDPAFEPYGNFIIARPNCTRFTGYFFGQFPGPFTVDTDEPALIETLTKAIRANQATPAYAAARQAKVSA